MNDYPRTTDLAYLPTEASAMFEDGTLAQLEVAGFLFR